MHTWKRVKALLPFWLFVVLFKFGGALQFALLSWLGIKVMDVWIVGILVGCSSAIQLLLDVPTGYIVDRHGHLMILRIGTACFIIAGLVLLPGLNTLTFLLTLIFSTLGWVAFGPGASAYVLSSASKGTGGRYMGLFHTAGSLGVVLSAIALMFAVRMKVPQIGMLIAAILFGALFWLLFARQPRRPMPPANTSEHSCYYIRRHFVHHLITKLNELHQAFSVLAAQYFVGSIFYAAIWFVLPLLLVQQAQNAVLGLGLSVFDLSIVILGSSLGKLADHGQRKQLISIGLLLFAVMATATSFGLNVWFFVFGFLATAGDELSEVSLWSWIAHIDPAHDQDGMLTGIVVLFGDLGYAIGPIVAGFLYGSLGPEWAIALCAIPIFALWLAFLIKNSRSKQSSGPIVPHRPPERLFRFRNKH
jgi:MFS family permease